MVARTGRDPGQYRERSVRLTCRNLESIGTLHAVRNLVAIAVFGALGALSRYGADRWIGERLDGGFPWGIFIINVVGSFLIGVLWVTVVEHQDVALWVKSAGTTGFLGAFTTFSTFSLLTVQFLEDGQYGYAFANSFGSLTFGVLAAWGGLSVGRALV